MLAVGVGAFATATQAFSSSSELSNNLPIAQAAKAAPVPQEARNSIERVIGEDLGKAAGLTESSLDQASILGDTDAGPVVVVPGAPGTVCATILYSVACGKIDQATDSGVVVSLYATAPNGLSYGGAVTTHDVAGAWLVFRDGSTRAAAPVPGGYIFNGTGGPIGLENPLMSERTQQ